MGNNRTPPIEPQDYIYGVNVVDIGDVRVARGMTRRSFSMCRHLSMRYDQQERRIWCSECESDVEAFDAFKILVEHFSCAQKKIDEGLREAKEAISFSVISLAAKEMDKQWRRKSSVPACPHCHVGLLPEDALKMRKVSKDIEMARRKKAGCKTGEAL